MPQFKKSRIILYFLLVCWMIFIFVMSAQQASKSSQLSGGIVDEIITTFIKKFDSLPLEKQEKSIYTITFLLNILGAYLQKKEQL